MPKLKERIFTETLYTYLSPENYKFLDVATAAIRVSRAFYLNTLLDRIRKGKLTHNIKKPPTNTELAQAKHRKEMERKLKRKSKIKTPFPTT